ncbi:hypothetical protein PWT90_04345 [Aphanocladium album]|nr:hypothetical protein PWT90_04345 [Aphanocladium album]
MIVTKSFPLKALAATTAGISPLVVCFPVSGPGHIATRCVYPLSLCGRDAANSTSTSTTSVELITSPPAATIGSAVDPAALAAEVTPTSLVHLSTAVWTGPKDVDATEGISADDLDYIAGLIGLTSSQMSKLNLETSDPALEESSNSTIPSSADIALASNVFHARRNGALERRADEIASQEKLKRIQSKKEFWLGLINATPYPWKLLGVAQEGIEYVYSAHRPRHLQPGESLTLLIKPKNDRSHAEYRYRLHGTSEKTWFSIKVHPGYPHLITAEYGGALETVGRSNDGKPGSIIDLGVERGVYCPTYILSGVEGRFYDNNAPPNWMNSMMQDIGNYTFRDIMLPRSHHTGMYLLHKTYGFGSRENTLTQDFSVYDQLKVGGVRVIDCRPLLGKDGKIYEGHGTKVLSIYHGSSGVSHDSMIEQINRFNDDYPGELIIIDVDGNEMRGEKNFKQLSGGDLAKLVESFKRLKHRANVTAGQDISTLPLNQVLNQGESTVIIRMEEYRIRELIGNGWPGTAEGFITPTELPLAKFFSEQVEMNYLQSAHMDQLIQNRRGGNKNRVFETDFIMIQQGLDLLRKDRSITKLSDDPWLALILNFWSYFHKDYYPNWLAMDAVRGTELKGIAMAVNQCFAAKRCGKLRGRVPAAEPFHFNSTAPGIAMNGTIDIDLQKHKVVGGQFVNAAAVDAAN